MVLAAARSARGYDSSRGSLWMWLSGIARNSVALHFRKQQRRKPVHSSVDGDEAANSLLPWLENRQADHQTSLVEVEGTLDAKSVSILIDPSASLSYVSPSIVEGCKL